MMSRIGSAVLVAIVFHSFSISVMGSEPLSAQAVIDAYYEERMHLIEVSMRRNDPGSEFYQFVKKEKELLDELRKPGNRRLQIMTIVFNKSESIHVVSETIRNERNKKDELSNYFIADYEKRLDQLKRDLRTLEDALK
jgi:predicted ferric reductase